MRLYSYIIIFLTSLIVFVGCINPARHLGKDEYLLHKTRVIGNENISTEELEALQRQKPNRRFLVFPIYVWFYYWGQNTSDKKRIQRKIDRTLEKYDEKGKSAVNEGERIKYKKQKERKLSRLTRKLEKGSLFMRAIRPAAEKPVVYQEELAKNTVAQMELFMRSRGYFNSDASYSLDTVRNKRIRITYRIKEKEPHVLGNINYVIEDSAVSAVLNDNQKNSLLKPGENYNVPNLTNERERIERLLKNNGFYYFNRQYIEFEYDSTVARYTSDSINNILGKKRVDVDVLIHNPPSGNHKVYNIDSVYFIIDKNAAAPEPNLKKQSYRGIIYSFHQKRYSKRILNYKVYIRPGENFSLENTIETQRQLINLDNFKFANVEFDTTGRKFIGRITASPASKYTTSEEVGFSVSQGLPGPTANVSFKVRNVLKGFENFEAGLRYTFEGVTSPEASNYRSQEVTGSASLLFPQTLFPFNPGFKRTLNRYNAKTRILSSYTFIDRPEYSISNLRGSFIYTWQKGLHNFYSISPLDLILVNVLKESDTFLVKKREWQLENNPLYHSFEKALISSVNGYFTYNNFIPGINKNAEYFNFYAESGGTLLNLFDSAFVNENNIFKNLLNDYRVFSYIRFSTDLRKYIPTGKKSTFASRINLGFARPYLTKDKALPYQRYFFSGGSSSIRAWTPRTLGPGSFQNEKPFGAGRYYIENPGEILIEMSVEERFPILNLFNGTRLDGALFLDAGNVWGYYNTKTTAIENGVPVEREIRPGASFEWDRFYKEFAVGAGFGLRFNLSFLIIRGDFAYKLYDPSIPLINAETGKEENFLKKRWVLYKTITKDPAFHLGINYPF